MPRLGATQQRVFVVDKNDPLQENHLKIHEKMMNRKDMRPIAVDYRQSSCSMKYIVRKDDSVKVRQRVSQREINEKRYKDALAVN